jgi:hypothetical protein
MNKWEGRDRDRDCRDLDPEPGQGGMIGSTERT